MDDRHHTNWEWSDLHGFEETKELVKETTTTFNTWINDNVDYEVHVEIKVYDDMTREVEITDETLLVYDDEGALKDSFSVTLPPEYRENALLKAHEYEV